MSTWPTAPCKSCKAPLIWGVTDRGIRVAVDADPVSVASGVGTVRLSGRSPELAPRAVVVRHQGQMFGATEAYRKHMETCPFAERYRARAKYRGKRRAP